MPLSSNPATKGKRKKLQQRKSVEQNADESNPNLLKVECILPDNKARNVYFRSHSTLDASSLSNQQNAATPDSVCIEVKPDGSVHISRTQDEKEKHPDRISLDRRGLTAIPTIDKEPKLRLLSFQHNLINNIDGLCKQKFPFLVFLDVYDNQLEFITGLDRLENLRVLLMGKNRIRKIEKLNMLKKIEVLDLHGNQISQIEGLRDLNNLKVLNLAGNQIKTVGQSDLCGLNSLQELNLRRNKLRKLLGFAEAANLEKLFVSHNDIQCLDDILSLANLFNLKEISIENNPLAINEHCVPFLVSYLPHLTKLNTMCINEQVRKTATAWRTKRETTDATFMSLSHEIASNNCREEVILNARSNWEFVRTQTKCLTKNTTIERSFKHIKPEIMSKSFSSPKVNKTKARIMAGAKVPALPDKKLRLVRNLSVDTENSQSTSSSNSTSCPEMFKLPPILVPIISGMEQRPVDGEESSVKFSNSLSSIDPNVDSGESSLTNSQTESETEKSDTEERCDVVDDRRSKGNVDREKCSGTNEAKSTISSDTNNAEKVESNTNKTVSDCSSVISSSETNSTLGSGSKLSNKSLRSVKSADGGRNLPSKYNVRAVTAKVRKAPSPPVARNREQGTDYLIEICGRHLNIYGQVALKYIDKSWSPSIANDVNTVKFNYVNFNSIPNTLYKLKVKFPNIEHFIFKETNISYMGQINALAEVQGLYSLYIDPDGNPITEKDWENYAIYRLAHWGLAVVNNRQISEEDIRRANEQYQSLSDLVLWTLPECLLEPLLQRLKIDVHHGAEKSVKKWLAAANPELRSVVCKETLQWKKGLLSQENQVLRQKSKAVILDLLDETTNAIKKLRLLNQQWPAIMHEFVQNTLLDYSQIDMYMKQKMHELQMFKTNHCPYRIMSTSTNYF